MPRSLPSTRTAAVLLLLVVGVALSFSFHVTAADPSVTYTATPVEPDEQPDVVTRAATNVTNLDDRLAGTPTQHRQPIHRAAATGAYNGSLDPELDIVVDDIESPYVWYNGSYYTWSISTDSETTAATIRMQPTDAETVFEQVSQPTAGAPAEVTTAIEEGTATGFTVDAGLYQQDGQYYAVAPEREGAVLAELGQILAGFVLTPVGRGYTAVAIGLLAYRVREPTRDRPVTPRRALGIAALALPVAGLGTAVFESGSLTRFVTGPASALAVAAGTVAGVFAARRQWLRLVGVSLGTAVVVAVAFVAALGVVGAILGPLAVLLGFVAGSVPFAYGYWFAQPRREH
ncbi:hypothetical protein [Halobacterium sp. CBA1126]|uniref:hypothetical protein n=1 Tax=Halobacterium TaxID=2239 RepID=UPI0012F7CB0D|nr:hypothetical protein [Halobacterium sp. CBA1126]MUV60043.1 hypothetical protein [Halobacterium sp. CBA1126]